MSFRSEGEGVPQWGALPHDDTELPGCTPMDYRPVVRDLIVKLRLLLDALATTDLSPDAAHDLAHGLRDAQLAIQAALDAQG